MIVTSRGQGYASAAPAENQLIIRHKRTPLDGTAPVIIGTHGHGGDVATFQPGVPTISDPGWHAWMLAMAGYIILAVDHGGGAAWGNAAAMSRLDDAYAYAQTIGGKPGKVGLMGWSMGGLTALNWIKRNAAKVAGAWLWAPVSDLPWARTNGGWAPEITAAYPSGSAGYNVTDEFSSWRGIGVPVVCAHADDDGTVPASQSDAFVAGVADAAVTKRRVTTGGHTGLFFQVPESETVQFFKKYL